MIGRSPLRIVVTGLAATYPLGGVFWDYIQYVLGFLDLGHDVLYLEDTGRWCYSPNEMTFVESGEANARLLAKHLGELDDRLVNRWFFRDAAGAVYGQSWNEVVTFCRSADLFLHISASCQMREEYFAADRVAFIDSDPMYTQASVPDYLDGTADEISRARIEMLKEHDVFFTFALNMGQDDCLVPDDLFDWVPTRQPLLLRVFEEGRIALADRRNVLTTVASWEPAESGPQVKGVQYAGKSVEFQRFLDLPGQSSLPIEVAMSGNAPTELLRDHNWSIVNAAEVSSTPWAYRRYLANSAGEWSVAKNAYVASRSGWFSCRSACYLALGVPVVVQQTGFESVLPGGIGLLPFKTVQDALAAIDSLKSDPERHSRAALEIAAEFDSRTVLSQVLDHASRVVRADQVSP